MKTATLIFVLCTLLTLPMSGQQASKNSTPLDSSGVLSYNPNTIYSNIATCNATFPNYTNAIPNGTNGVSSQDFEITYDAFDNMAADDFEAPGSGESTICEVFITGSLTDTGFGGDPGSGLVFRLFENDGGLPGTLLYTENFPGTVDTDNDGSFLLELTGGPALMGGTKYWLSVQAILFLDLAGQWFWGTASDGNGDIYAWQNPLDGFGFGCVLWTPHTNCSLSPGPDLLMDIAFNESLGTNSNSLDRAFRMYPNPANNQFTLQTNISLEKLTIFDLSGRMVDNVDLAEMKNEKTIDVSYLASGVYMVRITSNQRSIVKKLVKQ